MNSLPEKLMFGFIVAVYVMKPFVKLYKKWFG